MHYKLLPLIGFIFFGLFHRTIGQCGTPGTNLCQFVDCGNSGKCVDDDTNIDCYRCQCDAGYTGKNCETLITVTPGGCNPACANGGVCIGNTCSCPTGFNGAFCQSTDYCAPNPCQNGGRCFSSTNSYVCDCAGTGFGGSTCSDPIITNVCASQPCQNGGVCSVVNNGVSCSCVNGYSGTFCQISPLLCASNPCQNGGQCQQTSLTSYQCVCTSDFIGTLCETSILVNHPCITQPATVCRNGGTCTVDGAGYNCRCAPGWTGTNCQTSQLPLGTCNPSPCGSQGTCFEATSPAGTIAVCSCASGWTGRFCDVSMDVTCPTGFCLSGGICSMVAGSPVCSCPPQFTGVRCEIPPGGTTTTTTTQRPGTNFCSPNPCLNGGLCFSGATSFMCSCSGPWTGATCAVPQTGTTTTTTTQRPGTNFCSPNPCLNGGLCFNGATSFLCSCSGPWTGATCAVPQTGTTTTTTTVSPSQNPCLPNPCQNGGNCYRNGNNFVCYCSSQWTGNTCSTPTSMTTTAPITSHPCASSPCLNGGTCFRNGNTFVCACRLGWGGTTCAAAQSVTTTIAGSIQACASNTCQNGGTCYQATGGGFTCVCLSPWIGSTCAIYSPPNLTTTAPAVVANCPLNCTPGTCILTGNTQTPYACNCGGVTRPNSC